MVEFATPRSMPQARPAGQVSNAPAQILDELSASFGQVADKFTQYYEEKAAIERERILFEIEAETQRAYNDSAKDAGPGYAKSFVGGLDARIAERMKTAPERGRDGLDLALEKYRTQIETQALKAEAAARARAAAKAKAAANKAAAEARQLRGNALLSEPGLLSDMIEQDPENEDYYAKLALSARLQNDPEAIRDEMQAGTWDANLSPSEKLTFMKSSAAGVNRMAREAEAELRLERQAFESALDEELAYASANGAPPIESVYSDEMLDALYDDESQRNEVKRAYTEGIAVAEMVYGVSTSSADELVSQMEGLTAAVRKPGNTPGDVDNLNRFVSALDQRNEAIREDPAKFVWQADSGSQSAYEAYATAEPEDKNASAEIYARSVQNEYERLGIPVDFRQLLPKQVAQALANGFNDMAPDVVAASLVDFMGGWGDAAPQVMAELGQADMTPEFAVAMRHWSDPGLAAEIAGLRGQSESDLAEGIPSTNVTDMNRELDDILVEYRAAFEAGDITGQATNTFNLNYSVAKRLALKRMREGMDASAAVESVANRMFPEETILEPNARVVMPVGTDGAGVRQTMDKMQADEALRAFKPQPLDDPRLPEFADLEVLIASAIDNGVWLNNSTGDGAVLHLDLGGYLLPITNSEGEYYQLHFADAVGLSYRERVRMGVDNLPLGGLGVD